MDLFKLVSILFVSMLLTFNGFSQKRDTVIVVKKDSITIKLNDKGKIDAGGIPYDSLSKYHKKKFLNQIRKDSILARKKVWISPLGGPSYTPEASLGIGGVLLMSFKMNKDDSLSQRSFIPIGFNVSINGTINVSGAGTLFFNENKFRIYANYGYRNEPTHYYGKGTVNAETTIRGKETTEFQRESVLVNPRFVWMVKPSFYLGTLLEINYSKSYEINPKMELDPYFNSFKSKYTNIGVGAIIQYDTRDDVATPTKGMFISGIGKVFGRYLGGAYNYQKIDLEYRQFQHLFNRTTLAWVLRSQVSFGDVPFSELPSFGSTFDLRGFYQGQYRDKSMGYGIVEYRHMFGSEADLNRGKLLAKLGFVTWIGTGVVGDNVTKWNSWKLNYGVGLRIQVQPRKNFRFDIGRAHGVKGFQMYMNLTETF